MASSEIKYVTLVAADGSTLEVDSTNPIFFKGIFAQNDIKIIL